jgi:hypothetical protein
MEDKNKIDSIKKQIKDAEEIVLKAREELARLEGKSVPKMTSSAIQTEESRQVIEGNFNGQNMVDEKKHEYPVPANYASKSKLVEGDRLKLVITGDGSFIYKQIGPVERKRVIGTLMQEENGEYYVVVDGKPYRVLLASVTYFRVKAGDEVALLIPSDRDSTWGAIENVFTPQESSGEYSKKKEKKQNSAEDLEEEWTPDLDAIKKEAPDEEDNLNEDEFEF